METDQILLIEAGERIREQRMAIHLTQSELAERMGISIDRLINLEAGFDEMTLEELCSVAMALNINIDYIVGQWPIADPLLCIDN